MWTCRVGPYTILFYGVGLQYEIQKGLFGDNIKSRIMLIKITERASCEIIKSSDQYNIYILYCTVLFLADAL